MMGEILPEVQVSSEIVREGRLLQMRVDTVRLANGNLSTREVVAHRGAVAIVPILPDGRLALVRQWRYAVGQPLLEIPAGTLDPGESPETCAARELMEEVGYRPNRLTRLTAIFLAPGYSSECIHLFLAEELTPERLEQDEDEALEPETLTWEQTDALIDSGEITDAKTIAALALARRVLASRR